MVTLTVATCPVTIELGRCRVTNPASLVRTTTDTGTFGVAAPKKPAPSADICHWKLTTPGVNGATALKLNVVVAPGATGAARTTELIPHADPSTGFWDRSR